MAITFIHSGTRDSVPVKGLESFVGFYDPLSPIAVAYHSGLKAGKIVTVDSDGFVKLCDGAVEAPIGVLARNFIEFDLGSNSTPGDQGIAVMLGDGVFETDQIVTTESFVPGDLVYAGTGANIGLFTKTSPAATAMAVGICRSTASAAAPTLKVQTF